MKTLITESIEIKTEKVAQIRRHLEIQAKRVKVNPKNKLERSHMLGMMEIAQMAGIDCGIYNWIYLID